MDAHTSFGAEPYQREPLSALTVVIRLLLGLALSAAGSYVIFLVLFEIKAAYENPEVLNLLLRLVPDDPALRTLVLQGQEVILPLAAFNYLSYCFAVLLLFVAGLLGGMLLKRGISLIVP